MRISKYANGHKTILMEKKPFSVFKVMDFLGNIRIMESSGFCRIFTPFLLFLDPAVALTMRRQFPNPVGQTLTFT